MEKSCILFLILFFSSVFGAPLIIKNDPPPPPPRQPVQEEVTDGIALKRSEQPVLEEQEQEIAQNYFELIEEEERTEAGPNSSFLR